MKNRESKTIKKTATALAITVFKFKAVITPSKPFKRRSTTTKPRLATYSMSGSMMGTNLVKFVDFAKFNDILKTFNSDNAEDFIEAIGRCFPQQVEKETKRNGEKLRSKYQLLDFSEFGVKVLLRVSDHNINCNNIIEDVEETFSLAFKSKESRNTFKPNDLTVTEYVYFTEKCDRNRYLKIAKQIKSFLETSEWDESIAPADAKNISPMKKNEKVGNLQGIKTGASRGKTKKTKYLCDTCQWYVGCTWCKDGKKSVCDGYKPYNTDYEYPSFDGICGAKKTATALIYKIPLKVKDVYKSGEKMNISLARNMAIGLDLSENELMQLCELGLVIEAKRIAVLNEPLKFRFEKMVDLYGRQLTIQPKDSRSATLQQYSTPCPLAFLLGEYVKKGTEEREDDNIKFFEPTAGNGLLTISFRAYQMVVNELDDIRFNNLKRLGFFRTTNEDATCSSEPLKCFSGIIANPPFAPLEKKDFLVRKGVVDGREATYEFDRLDHKIAIMALDHMKDDGRAAIIIGGKMAVKLKDYKESYWKNGVLFGGFRNFITYLNRQYNIEDILYINGDLYRKQGTTFPIVAILINGRTKWNGDKRHQWHPFDEAKDGQIDTFNELYHRMSIHLEEEPTAKNKLIVDSRNTMRSKALMLKMKMAKSRGLDGIDEDKCIKQIAVLHKAADSINNWIEKNKSGRFFIKLPRKVEKEISKIIGRSVDVHKIDSNGIRHSLKNHGEKGRKLQINDIPIKKEYYMLIPYIMVSPDYIEKGSNDFGRESIRFVKNLSNGTLIVVEKESLNDKDVFETVNMWGTLSDVVNAKSPNIHVRNVAISTSDVANIIKDAELAIIKDEKK